MRDTPSNAEKKPIIYLSLNQVGVIVCVNSGVVYRHQTGGTACRQRWQEGVLLLPTDPELIREEPVEIYRCSIEAALQSMDWQVRLDEERATVIDMLLKNSGTTAGISVDRTRLHEAEEGWVPVELEPIDHALYEGFGDCQGILVWNNSD
ncbi:MAG: hypothetical protein J2P36_02230 [Ktedonobacteraceae bacterium]|nr:hypothetical protein [Ktedonobacteraceae bacterium]